MQFKGKIKAILPERTGTSQSSGKPWRSQEFVVEDDTQRFPLSFVFNTFNKDLSQFAVGDIVIVSFDGEAREWQGKWFNRLNAYQIVHESQQPQAPDQPQTIYDPQPAPYQPSLFPPPQPQQPMLPPGTKPDDDLPF